MKGAPTTDRRVEQAEAIVRGAFQGEWPTATAERFRIQALIGSKGVYFRLTLCDRQAEDYDLLTAAHKLAERFENGRSKTNS